MCEAPFVFIEEKIDEDWIPKLDEKYLIKYQWLGKDKEKPVWLIGWFSKTRENLYHFHWYWSASSLQLSTDDHRMPYPDWKSFKKAYIFRPIECLVGDKKPEHFPEKDFKI